MRYLIYCLQCGETFWCGGEEDPDTNGFEPDFDNLELESDCPHEDFNVIDQEYPDAENSWQV